MSDPEKNKRLLREQRERSQRLALPSALPGAPAFELQNPLSGYAPPSIMVCVDPPSDNPEHFMAAAAGFPSQALGPTFLSYGPMTAEGDLVIEEWESHIFGGDGSLYNNQYCWILRYENDTVVSMREYNDSHHAWLTFSPHGGWEDVDPPTSPRRRDRTADPALPVDEIETGFEVDAEFELDPRLLSDLVPSAAAPPVPLAPGIEGNKALVRGLRQARAAGDPAVVGSFFAEGFRHFFAGERPFGWDHLPIEEIYAPLVEHLASPITVRYGPPIADGDVVVEEMDIFARLDDGTVYNNWHCIFHDIRDGKIVQTREYLDTRHVWVVLGRWATWGKTPVTPRTKPRRSNLQAIHMTTQTPTMFLELDRWKPFDAPG
jgi:ketosteroid isomerase-like protein